MTNSATLGSFGDASNAPLVFRNKIINGGFDIWQRGTSQTSSGYGSDDRWGNTNVGSTKTASQQTFTVGQTDVPNNPRYWARTVVTTSAGASNYCLKYQCIENVATLSGQTATLSFWAKADAAKNIAVEFAQNFGSGGSPSATVNSIGVTTFALTTNWKLFTTTVSIPSISGKTLGTNNDSYLQVLFWFDAGSSFNSRTNSLGQQSGTFDISNVQLEQGLAPTPFEQRPIGMELNLCQRYFQQFSLNSTGSMSFYGYWTSATQASLIVNLPVFMRSTPTFSYSNVAIVNGPGNNGTVSSVDSTTYLVSPWGGRLVFTVTGTTSVSAGLVASLYSAGSTSYVSFSAEL